MTSISSYDTSCINSSSQVWPEISGVMAKLVGEFLGDLKYSELPSLPTELATSVKSPSGLAGNMGVANEPSVSHAWFELILLFLMAAGVAVLKAVVLVSAWSAWASPALAGKLGRPDLYMRILDDNSRALG